jgi:hypothetical protein
MSTELTHNKCVGKTQYHLSNKTNWYTFNDTATSEDTRCEYCYRHMLARANNLDDSFIDMIAIINEFDRIDCDSINDPKISMVDSKGFMFQITDSDSNTPFLLHPAYNYLRANSMTVVEMPETTKYAINIYPTPSITESQTYYVVDVKVGDKKVMINAGLPPVYYHNDITIHGYDSSNEFEFVVDNYDTHDLVMKKNDLIEITIHLYDRQPESNQFNAIDVFKVLIQLSYVNPDIYQAPNNAPIYKTIRDNAADYHLAVAQKIRHEKWKKRQAEIRAQMSHPPAPHPQSAPTQSSPTQT